MLYFDLHFGDLGFLGGRFRLQLLFGLLEGVDAHQVASDLLLEQLNHFRVESLLVLELPPEVTHCFAERAEFLLGLLGQNCCRLLDLIQGFQLGEGLRLQLVCVADVDRAI